MKLMRKFLFPAGFHVTWKILFDQLENDIP